MSKLKSLFVGLAGAIGLATVALTSSAGAAVSAPPTAEEWAKKPAFTSVRISPDGKHVAAVTSPDGVKSFISVWDLDNLPAGPKIVSPPPRNWFTSVQFLKNDRIVVGMRQPLEASGEKNYIGRQVIMSLDGSNPMTTGGDKDLTKRGMGIIDRLPKDPKNILVQGRGIFKLDVYSGALASVQNESDKFFGIQVDNDGDIRARQSVDFKDGNIAIVQWIRDPATGSWDEHFRFYAKDREPMQIVGFTNEKNIAYVQTTRGRDKAAIYEYDIHARKLLDPAFEHKLFDADDVITSRAPGAGYGEVLGFSYAGPEGNDIYWIDGQLKSIEDGAKAALKTKTASINWVDVATGAKAKVSFPDGAAVHLIQWSDDRTRAIIVKTGANTPAEYYLLVNGQLKLLGRAMPWIKSETLGDMRLVQYPARDGLMIPGYLTTPPAAVYGKGPFPTIILPHGGPWARDELGWDGSGWVQWFAARGYAVLQPQFRGSQGWGQKIWRAGDAEWGQKMQDDMDDGARYLIAQGIAAPDRIAMHGFSYGGYSAMAAIVRPNGLYQCAMAGAGVADLAIIKTGILTDSRWGKEFQEPTIDGLDPLRHANQASIPILLYHGDFDHTVELSHSEKYASALRGAGKDVTFVKIPGLSHSAGDTPELQVKVLTTLENYLKTKCGPGGL